MEKVLKGGRIDGVHFLELQDEQGNVIRISKRKSEPTLWEKYDIERCGP